MDYSKYVPILNLLIWPQLQYFNTGENWGDYRHMDVRLLWNLDRVRNDFARKMMINCGFEMDGHALKSFHKLGMAVDFYVEDMLSPKIATEMLDLYKYFLTVWQGGLGVYPCWNTPGFHFDLGPDGRTWVRDENNVYHYGADKVQETLENMYEHPGQLEAEFICSPLIIK
jgi:hypothetical protein